MSLIVAEVEKIKDGCETAIYKCGCCVLRGARLRRDFDGCGVSGAEEGKKGLLYNFLRTAVPTKGFEEQSRLQTIYIICEIKELSGRHEK